MANRDPSRRPLSARRPKVHGALETFINVLEDVFRYAGTAMRPF